MWSQKIRYALRGLIALSRSPGERVSIREIAGQCRIPHKYLEAIFREMRGQGFLESAKGPRGGYFLLKDPGRITLLELIAAVEPEWFAELTALQHGETGVLVPEGPLLTQVTEGLYEDLRTVSVADAVQLWLNRKNVLDYSI